MNQHILRIAYGFAIWLIAALFTHATTITVGAIGEGTPTTYLNPLPPGPELNVIGVYSTVPGSGNPTGNPVVNVKYDQAAPMKPITLVLSSYEANVWQLNIDPLAKVEKIVVNGFYNQTVTGAGSIPIVTYNERGIGGPRLTIGVGGFPDQWPLDTGGGNTQGFLTGLENALGTRISSFTGVHRASQFTVTGSPLDPPTVNPIVGAGNLVDGVDADLIYDRRTGEVKMNLDDLAARFSEPFTLRFASLKIALANHDGSFNVAQAQSAIDQLSFHDIAFNVNRVGLDYVDMRSWDAGEFMSFGRLLPPGIPNAAALRQYFAGAGYGASPYQGSFDLFVIPEPSTAPLACFGALLIAASGYRARRHTVRVHR